MLKKGHVKGPQYPRKLRTEETTDDCSKGSGQLPWDLGLGRKKTRKGDGLRGLQKVKVRQGADGDAYQEAFNHDRKLEGEKGT